MNVVFIETARLNNGTSVTLARGKTYPVKEIFKAHGFRFCEWEHAWMKENINEDELGKLADEIKQAGLEVEVGALVPQVTIHVGRNPFATPFSDPKKQYIVELLYGSICVVLSALNNKSNIIAYTSTDDEAIEKGKELLKKLDELGIQHLTFGIMPTTKLFE